MKTAVALVIFVLALGAVAWWVLKDRPEAESPYADAMLEGMEKANIVRVQEDFRSINQALSSYMASEGEYPEGHLGRALGPYMARVPMQDPWQTPVRYERQGSESYSLRSAGPDKAWNTSDDILMENGSLTAP